MFTTVGLADSAGVGSSDPTTPTVPVVNYTAAQKQALQAEVTKHLQRHRGGKQIGINEIAYENGALIATLPLPGEKAARAVNEPITALGTPNCPTNFACLWTDSNFNGTRLRPRSGCGRFNLAVSQWDIGSIHNNQRAGRETAILNGAQEILNANLAPSKVNDTGVGSRKKARWWRVC